MARAGRAAAIGASARAIVVGLAIGLVAGVAAGSLVGSGAPSGAVDIGAAALDVRAPDPAAPDPAAPDLGALDDLDGLDGGLNRGGERLDVDLVLGAEAAVDRVVGEGACEPFDVNDEGIVTAMHRVSEGRLEPPCYVLPSSDGAERGDPRATIVWALLSALVPARLLGEVDVLVGYERCDTCSTLGFVNALDAEGDLVVLGVDLRDAADDPAELHVTLLHEVAHVAARAPRSQLDVGVDPASCPSGSNGRGCYTEASYLRAWIDEFWTPSMLAGLPADGTIDDEGGAAARCREHPGFIGAYAARHPEEDFAESFAAYVLGAEVPPESWSRLAFFDRYPDLVEVRERARSATAEALDIRLGGCAG